MNRISQIVFMCRNDSLVVGTLSSHTMMYNTWRIEYTGDATESGVGILKFKRVSRFFGTAIKESTTCVVNEKRSVIVTVDICLEINDENKNKSSPVFSIHSTYIYNIFISADIFLITSHPPTLQLI